LALIPLAREVFWAPMALAMMGGVVAATVLTLTFLPQLFTMCDHLETETQVPSYNLIVVPCKRCGYTVIEGDQCANCGKAN